MKRELDDEVLGKGLPSGAMHYRAFIGSPEIYDLLASSHFRLLTWFGLREHHYVLDIGAGSLRVGKLLIVYLLPGRYFAIEPNRWLIEEGIEKECGYDFVQLKKPTFAYQSNFSCLQFGCQFDFIFAHSVFSHASLPQIRLCLEEASKCMKPESVFLATYKKGTRDYLGNEWLYPERSEYRPETMVEVAETFGLRCQEVPFDTLIGQTWVAFTEPEHAEMVATIIASISGGIEGLAAALKWKERYENALVQQQSWEERYHELYLHPWVKFGRYGKSFLQKLGGRVKVLLG